MSKSILIFTSQAVSTGTASFKLVGTELAARKFFMLLILRMVNRDRMIGKTSRHSFVLVATAVLLILTDFPSRLCERKALWERMLMVSNCYSLGKNYISVVIVTVHSKSTLIKNSILKSVITKNTTRNKNTIHFIFLNKFKFV